MLPTIFAIFFDPKCVFYAARFMKPIFTWIAREDDDLDVDLIKNQMTKSSNY